MRLLLLFLALVLAVPARATVTTAGTNVAYQADGTTKTFPLPFRFLAKGDLQVSVISATGTVTAPTWTLAGTTVVLGSAPAAGSLVNIDRRMALQQPTSFSTQGAFSPKAHEGAFDRMALQLQQLDADRAALACKTAADISRLSSINVAGTADPNTIQVTAAGTSSARTLAQHLADTVSVKQFGAKGDGLTDDSLAFQAALDATAPSGGTVLVPSALYLTASTLVVPDGVTLAGVSNGGTELVVTGARLQHNGGTPAITLGARSAVRDLWVRGDSSAGNIAFTGRANTYNWSLNRVRATNVDVGVDIQRSWTVAVVDSELTHCATACLRTGSDDVNIITVRGGELAVAPAGALIGGGTAVSLDGVTIQNNTRGVHISGAPSKLTLHANYFEANEIAHIAASEHAEIPRSVSVEGNFFTGATITCLDAQDGVEWHVSGNHFGGTPTTAVQFGAATDRVHVGANYYAVGLSFDPATHYLGTAGGLDQVGPAVATKTLRIGGVNISAGSTTPESVATGSPGDLYLRTSGTVATVYTKWSGTGNTGWQVVPRLLRGTLTYDFASIPANTATFTTLSLSGVAVGDSVQVGVASPLPGTGGVFFTGAAVAADGVRIYAHNLTTAAVDPGEMAFNVAVVK